MAEERQLTLGANPWAQPDRGAGRAGCRERLRGSQWRSDADAAHGGIEHDDRADAGGAVGDCATRRSAKSGSAVEYDQFRGRGAAGSGALTYGWHGEHHRGGGR